MKRKEAIKLMTAGAAASTLGGTAFAKATTKKKKDKMELKGNINHSACRWCYNSVPMDTFLDEQELVHNLLLVFQKYIPL